MERRKKQMPREGGIDRNFCGFLITDLSHEDDIWILSDDRAETLRKGEIHERVHLDLIQSFHFVFNRIFNRRDIHAFFVQYLQKRVERCRFTRTGRTGDDDHTEGLICGFTHEFLVLF